MNRRDFLRTSAIFGSSSILPLGAFGQDTSPTKFTSSVLEVEGAADGAVRKIFEELGGLKSMLMKAPEASTVLLKPNICLPHADDRATTTSSELVGQLCMYLKEQGVARIIIADHTLQDAKQFADQPIVVEGKKHAKVLLVNEQRYYKPIGVKGKVLKETEVLKLLAKADLFINLPHAKHHTATHVSLGIKNLMGVIWDRSVFHTDLDLNQAIGDLATAIQPDITIMDATGVLLKGGPIGPGPVVKDNRYFAGRDMVAVDSVVAERYSFGGKNLAANKIAHIKAAHENGLGEIDLAKIEVKQFTV